MYVRQSHASLARQCRHLKGGQFDGRPPQLGFGFRTNFIDLSEWINVLIAVVKDLMLLRFLISQRVPGGSDGLLTETLTSQRREPYKFT
jgi:hypothetical protein